MSRRLEELHELTEGLDLDQQQDLKVYLLVWLLNDVPEDLWRRALAAAARDRGRLLNRATNGV